MAIEPGLSGVRLSFALAYWLDLAEDYPPALAAFRRVRDETEQALREQPGSFPLFHDIRSMNARLGEGLRTADLFESVAATNAVAAKRIYPLAERGLIRAGRFEACNKFLEPEARTELASRGYQAAKRFRSERQIQNDAEMEEEDLRHFMCNMATLVGLLVMNGRSNEAILVRDRALQDIDEPDFRTMLEAALAGHLPEQAR